jgi:hypothetical protein
VPFIWRRLNIARCGLGEGGDLVLVHRDLGAGDAELDRGVLPTVGAWPV